MESKVQELEIKMETKFGDVERKTQEIEEKLDKTYQKLSEEIRNALDNSHKSNNELNDLTKSDVFDLCFDQQAQEDENQNENLEEENTGTHI